MCQRGNLAIERFKKYFMEQNDVIFVISSLYLQSRLPKTEPRKGVAPEVDAVVVSQLPSDVETVFIEGETDEGEKGPWLCMKLWNNKERNTTIASHGQGETKEDAEREANLNLMHSIHALQ